jgi:hypothetical protein
MVFDFLAQRRVTSLDLRQFLSLGQLVTKIVGIAVSLRTQIVTRSVQSVKKHAKNRLVQAGTLPAKEYTFSTHNP